MAQSGVHSEWNALQGPPGLALTTGASIHPRRKVYGNTWCAAVDRRGHHGALSVHDGRVSVCWQRILNGNADPRIDIEWQETGGPAVRAPNTSGYGVEVIRDLIPYELGGTVDLAFASDGLRCRLEIPAGWLNGRHSMARCAQWNRTASRAAVASSIVVKSLSVNGFGRKAATVLSGSGGTA